MVWVIGVVVVLAIVVAAIVAMQRRSGATAEPVATPPAPPRKERPPDSPMSGLESALSEVTDRDGRPIGERIDAGARHVDDLRVPDDTGPILRRALDHAERRDESAAPGEGFESNAAAAAAEASEAGDPDDARDAAS